ncbi:PREDICTED: calcium-activated chloride channel regulator 4 [Condylura cristata]|uniref:calcium-activated chloride channel regulator 4 n=1 Tax=Condylura cristata TaxID=143302 RepID=UPI0003344546|nr:PREDICTED: calcium-activated chloride channel regulator 4 [Condylura cristata]
MGLFRSFAFFVLLHLLQGSNTSLVRLNDNGYEDIIIAIDPDVPEDETLIGKIKDMVTEASTYLFEATGKRLFFKNISILIPNSWKENPQYQRPKHESYTHADVKVAPPALPGEDEPYTRQFRACGEKGEYIHLTPDFVLGKKQNEYGPSGKLLVHEWAHLRWGVFDEYNKEEPYYAAKSRKIEATRCSIGITGVNRVFKCQEDICIFKPCRIDSKTKLYEKDCQFFPDQDQRETASIMFMQSINSINEFCTEKNHNREAPTLQNKMCNSRSTWEVISMSEDFKNTVPMDAPPPPPVFSLLRTSERIVCLVLDKSENMKSYNRLHRLNKAAKHVILEIVENGSWMGIVDFDNTAHIKHKLIQITSNKERIKLIENLPTEASGGVSICSGIEVAFQVIRDVYPQIDGAEIILACAGKDKNIWNCMDQVKRSGVIVHSITLGPSAEAGLIEMSMITGGMHTSASDKAENNGFMNAFRTRLGNTNLYQQSLQLESETLLLNSDSWMNDTITIDSTVGKDTLFFVTWDKQPPIISMWDPSGTPVGNFVTDKDSKMAYLHIPETAKVGIWTYSLQAKADSEILTITVNSRASNFSVPPITVNAKMNKDTNSFPSPMIVYAEVLQGYTPILGANVTAFIESQSGKPEVLQLLDNGAGADSFKNDGVYSRYFTTYTENGSYSLKVQVYGKRNTVTRGLRQPPSRVTDIPGRVVNGKFSGNPPIPNNEEDIQTTLGSFSRTETGGTFVIANVSNLPLPDLYPPSQITDLEATCEEDEISLTWTAPGDDFDVGRVQQYIIRMSENILDLRDNFDDALQVKSPHLLPNDVNSKETFAFKMGNKSEDNTTHLFIAIQSVDKSNLRSKISNIAQVALFIPQEDTSPDENHRNSRTKMYTVVAGSVTVISVILITIIYILVKRRNARRSGF